MGAGRYDVIVVGARVAGRGYRDAARPAGTAGAGGGPGLVSQ